MPYRTPMVFNNQTGSDSLASGVGPSTALTGSGAYCSGSSNVIDLSMDFPSLGTVQVGDCIYIPSLDGVERCFLEIASVTPLAYQVSVTTTISSSFSTSSWAIGGKRAFGNTTAGRSPFDQVNTDGEFYQQYEIEYTGTDYTHNAGVTLFENPAIVGTGSQMPKIVMTSNNQKMFQGATVRATNSIGLFSNLWITNNGVATGTYAIDIDDESIIMDHCKIGSDSGTKVEFGVVMSGTKAGLSVYGCEFVTSSTCIVGSSGSTSVLTVCNSSINSDAVGINMNNSSGITNIINNSITGGTNGVYLNQSDRFFVAGNAFNSPSIQAGYISAGETGGFIRNAIVNTTRGFDASGTVNLTNRVHGNYFHNVTDHTSGDWDTNNMYNSDYDVALGGDPFTSSTDTTLAGNTASDTLKDKTAADASSFEMSELRPWRFLDNSTTGGGGGSIIVIEE